MTQLPATTHPARPRGRRIRLATAVIAVISVALALSVSTGTQRASATSGASVSGKVSVVSGMFQLGVAGINVFAYSNSDLLLGETQTNSSGNYGISGLPAGGVHLQYVPVSSSPYLPQWYNDASSFATSTAITLAATTIDIGVNQTLTRGATIDGHVLNPEGTGIEDVTVHFFNSGGTEVADAITDSSGDYTSPALTVGSYRLEFTGAAGLGYVSQYFNNKTSLAAADAISVDTPTEGIHGANAVLVGTAAITGQVNSQTSGLPVHNIHVIAELATGGPEVGDTDTDSNGLFTIPGLPAGSYMLGFFAPGWVPSYWHDESPSHAIDPITRTAGQTSSIGIQYIVPGATIYGHIQNAGGSPIAATAVLYKDGPTDDATTGVETTQAGADGDFAFNDVAVGSYRVGFTTDSNGWDGSFALAPSTTYVSQWFNNEYSWSTSTLVNLTSIGQSTGLGVITLQDPYFADVSDPSYSLYPDIQWMASTGISTGTAQPSGKPLYLPANSVSRQAVASFLFKLSGDSFTAPATPTFADVDSSSPFYTAIEWMSAQGLSTGTAQPSGKPLFKPADAVSRQAAALFLARYAGVNISTPPTSQSFADVPVTSPAAAAIAWMKSTGLSAGTAQPSGLPLYKPADPVSRSAMAAFLYRLAHLV